ncbi:hypothetical protein SERLADRAFT_477686 [Serpula lacrymans var. lacrymans S7.9]|uniref:Uncharacterized protein n=1 Tax=Serpula lacrymans var. lacrymans (strain S7.9) TaxID=578457 RepID=F8P9E6_SERL9|nr:uncharacterized protein SERLADRAFT_477686 [Serpula lacrymans var. lacrymans S7.9]EGO20275.1 hypothetical protein SERLADRAFT_477686 [Serpula lacrymans var. lacrymans S7.9]
MLYTCPTQQGLEDSQGGSKFYVDEQIPRRENLWWPPQTDNLASVDSTLQTVEVISSRIFISTASSSRNLRQVRFLR